MYKKLTIVFSLSYIFLTSTPAQSEPFDFIQWHTTNIQYLRGWNYEVGKDERTIITFEYANSWTYGDFFMFVDATRFDGGGSTVYSELAPRFSLNKITGKDFSFGPIKDVLVSTQIEWPENQGLRHLYGVGFDWDIPGFRFFKSEFLVRDNTDVKDETYQLTLVWNRPIEINGLHFLAEGFADFAGREGGKEANELIVPRFLLDVGDIIGLPQNKLYTGIEYSYWHNKFGIKGTKENVGQFQVKLVF